MRILSIFFIVILWTNCTFSTTKSTVNHLKVDEYLIRQSVYYGLTVFAAENTFNSACKNHLVKIAEDLYNKKRWAVKLLDASGVPMSGLYWGSIYWLGSKSQCEAAGVLKNLATSPNLGPVTIETMEDVPPFPIEYYAAYFHHNSTLQIITHYDNEFRITLGLCLPKSCEVDDLKSLLQKYFDSNIFHYQKLYNTSLKVEDVKRLVDDYSWLWEFKTIVMSIIILFTVIMCIIGTIFDVKYYQSVLEYYKCSTSINDDCPSSENNENAESEAMHKEKSTNHTINLSTGYKILMCFSLYTNNKIVTNTEHGKDSIPSMHGLRFFSMLYAIVGHSILFMQEFFDNRVYPFYISDIFYVQIFGQAAFSVDTFFFIGGFVMGHMFFRTEFEQSKNRKYSVSNRINLFFAGVLKRFLRLTPSYMITLGIADVISTWRYRNTPFLNNERIDLICPNYWWRNMLYINTLYPRSEMCLPWSWYLSNDFMFFVVTNFFLVLSTIFFNAAATLYTGLFFGCIAYTIHLVYSVGFIPRMDELYGMREFLYDNPLVRFGPYIIGVYASYFLYRYKNTISFNKYVLWLCWIVFPCINLYLIFGLQDREVGQDFSAFYMGFARTMWAVGISWVLIACETGNAGVLNRILSYEYWLPFSRLTYLSYLVNPIMIFLLASYSNKPFQAEISNILIFSPGYIFFTFLLAWLLTLLFESPNIALNKMLFDWLKGGREKTVSSEDVVEKTHTSSKSDAIKSEKIDHLSLKRMEK